MSKAQKRSKRQYDVFSSSGFAKPQAGSITQEKRSLTWVRGMDERSVTLSNESTPVCRAALRTTAVRPSKDLGVRYNLDPAVGHGFGEHLIGQLPPDAPPY
jgi:hypothetical protein